LQQETGASHEPLQQQEVPATATATRAIARMIFFIFLVIGIWYYYFKKSDLRSNLPARISHIFVFCANIFIEFI